MRILDYNIDNATSLLDVDIQCSKCGQTYVIKSKKLSKCFMATCPHCGNIDIDRQASGDVPASVIKSLIYIDQLRQTGIEYTVEGKTIGQFLMATYNKDLTGQVVPKDFHVAGIYRLKNIFAQAQHKNKLDKDSFPDFETFMRWAVKHEYRDWKTIQPDDNGMISVASKWVSSSTNHKASQAQVLGQLQSIIDTALTSLSDLVEQMNDSANEKYDATIARAVAADIVATLSEKRAELAK